MVEIVDETSRFQQADILERTLERHLAELGLSERTLTVVLMDDETISRFNREHRGVDGPTDVLSYPTAEPDDVGMPPVEHLGDILVSVDTAARQAEEHGHELLEETLVLCAHGIAHLRGYDHQTEESWQIFREAQERILALKTAS